jgi:hypothetical protein
MARAATIRVHNRRGVSIANLLRIAAFLACFVFSVDASSITLNQIDDFQSGTVQNWSGGSSPINVATNGPAGAGDRYLEISASGFNLGTFNKVQWSGNYQTATVNKLDMHLNNFGPNALSIRVMLITPGCETGPNTCTAWTSTIAQPLASLSGWVAVSFSLAEANLTRVKGSISYSTSMSNVERLLIRHDDGAPSAPGSTAFVTADLGIDNVKALPEPSGFVGAIAGAAVLGASRRRRQASRR